MALAGQTEDQAQPAWIWKGRFCVINLITFYDQMICPVSEGKAVDIVYLDYRKAFDAVSYSLLLEKLAAHGAGRSTLCCLKTVRMGGPGSGCEWSYVQLVTVTSDDSPSSGMGAALFSFFTD